MIMVRCAWLLLYALSARAYSFRAATLPRYVVERRASVDADISKSSMTTRRRRRSSTNGTPQERFDRVARALGVYQALHGTMDVPLKYVVPTTVAPNVSSTPWPEDLHGFCLGSAIRSIRYKGDLAEYREHLEGIGFSLDKEKHNFELFVGALELYIQLNDGVSTVPRSFVVPSEAPWPPTMHGMKLGVKVSSTRHGRAYFSPARVDRLTALGFVWDPYADAADTVLTAARAFKKVYGHLHIPKTYTVPENGAFPRHTWGYGSRTYVYICPALGILKRPSCDALFVCAQAQTGPEDAEHDVSRGLWRGDAAKIRGSGVADGQERHLRHPALGVHLFRAQGAHTHIHPVFAIGVTPFLSPILHIAPLPPSSSFARRSAVPRHPRPHQGGPF